MELMIKLALALILIPGVVFTATISGKVTDKESNASLIGANVLVVGTKLGAATDVSGRYSIKDVPTGRIILKTSYVGYRLTSDTLTVSSTDSSFTVNFQLDPEAILRSELLIHAAQALSPNELQDLRAYQDSLTALSSRSSVLTIRLDTLYCIPKDKPYGGEMCASLTFHNNTGMPVYLLKNYPCLQRLYAVIVDSNGDTVKGKEFWVDVVSEQCDYESSDLIVVLPHADTQYPMSTIWLRSCRTLPNTECTIRIVYSYELPKYIYGASGFRSERSVPYLKAIQGTFATENGMHLHGEK